MEDKEKVLTVEEREVLILTAPHPDGRNYNNKEIGQLLGISASRVKTLIHQACAKLEAHNRNEAIYFSLIREEIRLDKVYTLEELAELFNAYHPDMLRIIMRLRPYELNTDCRSWQEEQIIYRERAEDAVLTKSERDVLILIGRGLTNREIADTLCISTSAVSTTLYRIYTKLGVHKRGNAVVFALKRGEIRMGEIYPLPELLRVLARLGPDSIEKLAQLLGKNLE